MPLADQGLTDNRYSLIPRTLLFITRGDRILLLKGAPEKKRWANLYNGVGGHVERGEDLINAARRELVEETGLYVDQLFLVGMVIIDIAPDKGIAIFVMKGQSEDGEPRASPEGTLEWINVNQWRELPMVEDLIYLLPRVLEYQVGDGLFYGYYSYSAEGSLAVQFSKS